MTMQINMKFQDNFFEQIKVYAEKRGYMSVQELVREALRDKIYDTNEIQEEYLKKLQSKEAKTFSNSKSSKKFIEKLKTRNERN